MHVVVIVNPISGRGRLGTFVENVRSRLRTEGTDVDVRHTGAAGEATSMAGSVPHDTHAVLTVGGDGTVREVIDGLAGRGVPLVIAPAGTENLVARECGMRCDADLIVDTVLHGRRQAFDVGVINGRHFGIMAGIGFDAEVVARLAEKRSGNITHLDYIGPIWRTFWDHSFPTLRVDVEGERVFVGRGLAFVGVMPCYSVGLRVVREAIWDDGLLDVCIMPCCTKSGLLAHAMRTVAKIHLEHGGVIYKRCRKLRVSSSEAVEVQVDGDAGGLLPVDISIRPAAGVVLLPPGRR